MSIADLEYVLPDDVDVVMDPVADEVIVSRRGSRIPPQVLSLEAWSLLERFRAPQTLSDAVLAHCTDTGADPMVTLDSAFPVLVALTGSQLLLPAGSDAVATLAARHTTGERVGPATLAGPIRVLRDSELWDAVLDDGAAVVVKVVDDAVNGPELFLRETTALRLLAGGPVPALVWAQASPTGGVLVVAHVEGDPVDLAALDRCGARGPSAALGLALATLDAYAVVHGHGVLHGDIHPGNVLADEAGRVTVIDFGISQIGCAGLGPAPRTGGGESLDPVAAQALRAGRVPPEVDVAAEVYALAALAYRIVTGASYLDLDLERSDALEAIVAAPPRSFAEVGRPAWPAVESVLRRGLAKEPDRRQHSVVELRADLVTAARSDPAYDVVRGVEPTAALVRACDVDGVRWAEADQETAAWTARSLQSVAAATGRVDAHDLAILWGARARPVSR